MQHHLRPIFRHLVAVYAGSLIIWWMLRLVFADSLWWLALVNAIALLLFLPLPLLLALALWKRSRKALAFLLLPSIAFVSTFGSLFLPAPAPLTTTPPLTAMTFNLLYNNHNLAALQQSITAAQPAILGVQELTSARTSWLKRTFSSTLPYSVARFSPSEAGVGLFSRYPISHVAAIAGLSEHVALRATVDVDGSALTVVVLHLSPNRALSTSFSRLASVTQQHILEQADETRALTTALAEVPTHLVLCDCNFADTSASYRQMTSALHDSYWERGWGFGLTFRAGGLPIAVQRLDYIWHSSDIEARAAWVGQDGGSDHFPVIAVLHLPVHQTP